MRSCLFPIAILVSTSVSFSGSKKLDKPPKEPTIYVYGHSTDDGSHIAITAAQLATEDQHCAEEYNSSQVFSVVSVGRRGNVLQKRSFDFVKNKDALLMSSGKLSPHDEKLKDGILGKGGSNFCIYLKGSKEVKKVQLFKGKKLIDEMSIGTE